MKGTPAQIAAYVGKSERTVHRWLASGKLPYKRLPGGLVEVDDTLLFGPESEHESMILQRLQRIEEKLDMLAAHVATLSRFDRHAPAHVSPVVTQDALPEGLVSWRDYCKEKGYPESTVLHAIDRGEVPIVRGKWKKGRVFILAAIDEEGKAAIDRLYGHQ
jgi:hypothetical protein